MNEVYMPSNKLLGAAQIDQIQRSTIRQKLEQEITMYEKMLANRKEALKMLNENPVFEKLHDLLSGI